MKSIFLFVLAVCSFQFSCTDKKTTSSENSEMGTSGVENLKGQSAVVDDVSQKNVLQVAIGSADHSTLVTAIQAAGLVDALSNAGPFTVFAPTNEAFNKLPSGTVDDLLKPENKAKLQDILEYHVSVGGYKAESFINGQSIGQVNGGNVTITNKDGKLKVNDANILASIQASNGVIHVIDGVLLSPPK